MTDDGPQILCLTGMHRSGTSLTASWLETCGLRVSLGEMFGPEVGNVKGHYEDKDFVRFHSRLIRARFPGSLGWKVASPAQQRFSEDEMDEARALVEIRNAQACDWAWKDPRTVLFLEQWKTMIPSLRVLFVWRHCEDVVRSLLNRSRRSNRPVMRIGPLQAVRTWMAYNEAVIEFRKHHPDDTVLVPLDRILNSDREVADLIAAKLGIRVDFQPIETILDTKMLAGKGSGTLASTLVTLVGRSRAREIEHRLDALSDLADPRT